MAYTCPRCASILMSIVHDKSSAEEIVERCEAHASGVGFLMRPTSTPALRRKFFAKPKAIT